MSGCICKSDVATQNLFFYGAVIENCIFIDGQTNVYADAGMTIVKNCTFFNTTVRAILCNSADGLVAEMNNIFYLAAAADLAVSLSGGSLVSSHNSCAYAYNSGTPVALTQAWPAGSVAERNVVDGINIEADPLFVDAANDDFRLLPTSPCLNTGKSIPDGNGNLNGVTSMGAWPRKSFIQRD